jgi:hypothetical protein
MELILVVVILVLLFGGGVAAEVIGRNLTRRDAAP